MRTILILLRKEFRQIFRNKALLPLLFIMPTIQLLILPQAADYEVKNINIAIVDHDHSAYSTRLVSKITSSGYFRRVASNGSFKEALELIKVDKADLILEIPVNFEKNLVRENEEKVFIAVNAINGSKAGLGGNYLTQIIRDFNGEIRLDWIQPERYNPVPRLDVVAINWYNPLMNYNYFMVPGILALLVTMVVGYVSSLNIVKEKEIGTIEQINVTPIRKHHFIIGKLLPFLILGTFIFTFGIGIVSTLIYGIIPKGSLLVLYGFLFLYLFAILGFGLLISTYADNQQQAMSISFFFVMIFTLMSGLFTPIESMPEWAKIVARCTPVSYFIEVMRMVVLKGSGFADIKRQIVAIIIFGIIYNGWAILNYKKTSG
jgi:ABC-2 type transport system permease protein